MPDATQVELLYGGSEVEDGTVPVEDMVDALVGFSGAYDKIARHQQGSDIEHRIRVVGLQKGSAKIVVDVVEWVAKNPAAAHRRDSWQESSARSANHQQLHRD